MRTEKDKPTEPSPEVAPMQGDVATCECSNAISMGPQGWVHEDSDQMSCERAVPAVAPRETQQPAPDKHGRLFPPKPAAAPAESQGVERAQPVEAKTIPRDLKALYEANSGDRMMHERIIRQLIERIAELEASRG